MNKLDLEKKITSIIQSILKTNFEVRHFGAKDNLDFVDVVFQETNGFQFIIKDKDLSNFKDEFTERYNILLENK